MRFYSINRANDRPDRRVLSHRSYYLTGVPRLISLCRIFDHKTVVDGTESIGTSRPTRWVTCDRCGIRPTPQGTLDPEEWDIGDRYTGTFNGRPASSLAQHLAHHKLLPLPLHSPDPGPWPRRPAADLGAELVIGRSHSVGADIKVGNRGSEHVLAAHISLGPLGALYLHTEDHGRWLQRRLNPTGYTSREIGFSVHDGTLWWKLWAKRHEWSRDDPKWMQGDFSIDPRVWLFGPTRHRKVWETDPVPTTVRMPEGDYEVTVQLEKWERYRTRGGRLLRPRVFWSAEWNSAAGIPVRNHDWKVDNTYSCHWGVDITADTPDWPALLTAEATQQITDDRERYNYRHAPEADAA